MIKRNQVIRLLVLAGAHLGLSSGELGLLFTSAAGQVFLPLKGRGQILFAGQVTRT